MECPAKYCPICQRTLTPVNCKEVESGEHDAYLWVHDDIVHEDEDLEALSHGVN
jgi:hypothetical protein